jgi:hypothetical protein
MNASTIVHYGHLQLLREFEGLADDEWSVVGVTTRWSLLDLLAHLASYEVFLVDVLRSVLGESPTPTLDRMRANNATFNDIEVAARKGRTPELVMAEYQQAHEVVNELLKRIPVERQRETGTLPWYGNEYSLEDFIVYANYGHKREHCAQVKTFRRTRARVGATG